MKKTFVTSGLDNLAAVEDRLRGKRLGLMTNPSAVDKKLRGVAEIIHEKYDITALYACEHGLLGTQQAGVAVNGFIDPIILAPVFRAYGGDDHIEPGGLESIEVFVYDMQQIGARFYTRLYALAYAMIDCAKRGIPVIVLDRINPIGGVKVAGTILDTKFRSFVGDFGLATRFGLTVGEYARYVKDYCQLNLDLTISPINGWKRAQYFDETDLPWVATSPNIPALSSAIAYIGTCIFEGTNVSEGRGTTLPFELIGAPWIDSNALVGEMRALYLPGIGFRCASFVPAFSKYSGTQCNGLQIHILDREAAEPFEAGLMLCEMIKTMYPQHFKWLGSEREEGGATDRLLGTDTYTKGLKTARELIATHRQGLAAYSKAKKQYHLYD